MVTEENKTLLVRSLLTRNEILCSETIVTRLLTVPVCVCVCVCVCFFCVCVCVFLCVVCCFVCVWLVVCCVVCVCLCVCVFELTGQVIFLLVLQTDSTGQQPDQTDL